MMTTFYRACMDQVQEAREGGGKPTTALLSSWKAVRAFDAVHAVSGAMGKGEREGGRV